MAPRNDIETDVRKVGLRIADLRRKLGWTQAELAEALDIEATTLSRLENGKRPFSLELVFLVAKCFRVQPAVFLEASQPLITGELPPAEQEMLLAWRGLTHHQKDLLLSLMSEFRAQMEPSSMVADK